MTEIVKMENLQCPCNTCTSKDWCKEQYKNPNEEEIDCVELCDWMMWCNEQARDI